MRGASPNGAHLWLDAKPLDAAIRQVYMPYPLSAAMVNDFK
jgi:hypothetical protein